MKIKECINHIGFKYYENDVKTSLEKYYQDAFFENCNLICKLDDNLSFNTVTIRDLKHED
jgi:hypothetical protein